MGGGLGPLASVEGFGALEADQRAEVARWCDQPGETTRAEFVARHMRGQPKRARVQQLETDPAPEQKLEEEPEARAGHGAPPSEDALCNMVFWDGCRMMVSVLGCQLAAKFPPPCFMLLRASRVFSSR